MTKLPNIVRCAVCRQQIMRKNVKRHMSYKHGWDVSPVEKAKYGSWWVRVNE